MAVTTKSETVAAPVERKLMIKPADIKMNVEGFHSRSIFIRLPADFTLADLNEASRSAWANIQRNTQVALRKWDQLRLVSFDEAWFVDATVSYADDERVVLCGIKKTDTPARNDALFEDAMFRIEWAGNGYAVIRKSDSVNIGSQSFTTVEQAKQHLLQQYPKKAS